MNQIDLHEKKILIVSEEELEELERALVGRECWLSDRIEKHDERITTDHARYKRRLKTTMRLFEQVNRLRQGQALIEG